MRKTITDKEFESALLEVIRPEDNVIVLYSGVWSFAHRFCAESDNVVRRIFDVINSVVGEERTLLLPAFTNGFVQTRKFDLSRDRSDCSGVLANHALHQPGFQRTRQPIHSYVVKGPKASEVLARTCTTAWGNDSVVAWMGEVNARIAPLGLPWHDACSVYHRIEEVLDVPYRYFKRFAGELFGDGEKIGPCEEIKYCYSLNVRPDWDYSGVLPRMQALGGIRTCENPLIPLQSLDAETIYQATESLLKDDIYAYVSNREQVKAWVANGKEAEIAALNPDERWSGY
jgi:aminoglycoside 3-N-acetyltransferase